MYQLGWVGCLWDWAVLGCVGLMAVTISHSASSSRELQHLIMAVHGINNMIVVLLY